MIHPSSLLTTLREILKTKEVDGFLIPMSDPFQNEMIPDHFNRIRFLTGFTGSAGMVLVTPQQAFLITDGRYTVQARQEVNPDFFTVIEGGIAQLEQTIRSLNFPNLRLGFDPWTVTESLYHSLKKLPVSWIHLVDNPVDFLWDARPPLPFKEITIHDESFAGVSSSAKRRTIAKSLKNQGLDAFLCTTGDTICWLLNIRGGDIFETPVPLSYAFFHADESVDFFVDLGKISSSVRDFLGEDVRLHSLDRMNEFFPYLKIVGFDPKTTPVALVEKLQQESRVAIDDPCLMPKACKNSVEQKGAIDCHKIDGLAVTKFLYWIDQQDHLEEIEASLKLGSFRTGGLHYKGPSFETISAVGPNGALCHYRPKAGQSRTFEKGDLYLIDSGGQYLNGTTDVTRTVVWKGTPTQTQKNHYTLVLKGHIALAMARFPKGTTGLQLDSLARQYLWSQGLNYAHGTGHGVGSYLSVHESPPSISPRAASIPLSPGMILSNEPGYYLEGHYGIRLENLMLVKDSKEFPGFLEFETLTLAPFDGRVIDDSLLSENEKVWVKEYHKKIMTIFEQQLTQPEQHWLKKIIECDNV
ncbi:MAG: aminopeptidase P family protein [Alphaproteobacteria bacterium]|nr:aminopeptidase P family protein [Alphaproteobacteria bacterium]